MLKFLIEKEFKQLARNSFIPKILIMMPLVMMLVMPWTANQEIKNLKLSIVDNDHSSYSTRLIQKIASSGYFKITDYSATGAVALGSIESGKADIIVEIPIDFERHLVNDGEEQVMISANSVNGIKGSLGSSYLSSILNDFSNELRDNSGQSSGTPAPQLASFAVSSQFKFNLHLDYKVFMIPALMVMLITMLCGFLPALNIVGEKEAGTIEQINVTPVRKLMFVLSKLIPYWVVGFLVFGFCILLGKLIYGISPVGNLLTIFTFTSIYILVVSGLGLIISNYSNTIQQAMFVMYFFILILILMSGLFTPVSSMPQWTKLITAINPLKYFMEVMRLVYLKGSAFGDMLPQFFALSVFALALNSWAVISYKKSN